MNIKRLLLIAAATLTVTTSSMHAGGKAKTEKTNWSKYVPEANLKNGLITGSVAAALVGGGFLLNGNVRRELRAMLSNPKRFFAQCRAQGMTKTQIASAATSILLLTSVGLGIGGAVVKTDAQKNGAEAKALISGFNFEDKDVVEPLSDLAYKRQIELLKTPEADRAKLQEKYAAEDEALALAAVAKAKDRVAKKAKWEAGAATRETKAAAATAAATAAAEAKAAKEAAWEADAEARKAAKAVRKAKWETEEGRKYVGTNSLTHYSDKVETKLLAAAARRAQVLADVDADFDTELTDAQKEKVAQLEATRRSQRAIKSFAPWKKIAVTGEDETTRTARHEAEAAAEAAAIRIQAQVRRMSATKKVESMGAKKTSSSSWRRRRKRRRRRRRRRNNNSSSQWLSNRRAHRISSRQTQYIKNSPRKR